MEYQNLNGILLIVCNNVLSNDRIFTKGNESKK